MSCFRIFIIIYRLVGEPGHGKDVFYGLNGRDKRTIKLETSKTLNTELIRDYPNLYKFMQVNESKEYQYESLATEARYVLSLLHTRDKITTSTKETPIFRTSLPHSIHKRCET